MAKNKEGKSKKTTAKKSAKGKNSGKIGQVLAATLLIVGVAFISWYLYGNYEKASKDDTPDTFVSAPGKRTEKPKTSSITMPQGSTDSKSNKQQSVAAKRDVPSVNMSKMKPEKDLRPMLDFAYSSQLIEHTAYVVSYNYEYKVPNWVLYELTLSETLGNLRRHDDFDVDPQVAPARMAQIADYKHSGYDRGHMAPNVDMNWNRLVQRECYYLTNMCPQKHEFNSGIWCDLENMVHYWAEQDSAITVVCGPVLPQSKSKAQKMTRIGKGKVLVPEYFYKVILSPYGRNPQAIAFLMPHEEKERQPLPMYAVSVDSIESLTGIDFFPALPDNIENRVESTYDLEKWFH